MVAQLEASAEDGNLFRPKSGKNLTRVIRVKTGLALAAKAAELSE